MAFEALLSAPCWVPNLLSRRNGPISLSPPKLESKHTRTGRNFSTSLPFLSSVLAKESSGELPPSSSGSSMDVPIISRREAVLQVVSGAGRGLVATTGLAFCVSAFVQDSPAAAATAAETKPRPKFFDLDGSGGVKALDIREGSGATPHVGDKVAIHYYARLAAKQGWRFDSSYEHKDQSGAPEPYVFVIGDGTVIAGLDSALLSMKEGGVRRVIIPPSQGYQNTQQGPIPPNFSDRQRLYTTIFNPTRLANGEGSTLGTLVFDIELLGIRPN
ncbi:unnamed protein product [Calypogeia fissa]